MIEFYKDKVVPPELCLMLCQVVPRKYHLPVRFHNRRPKIYEKRGLYPLGTLHSKKGAREPHHVDINLNPLYEYSWCRHHPYTWVPSAFVWRTLVEVCLHEFGHAATNKAALRMNRHEYFAEYGYGRVYKASEQLADEWMERSIARILKVDPRLGQPEHMKGYLGARLAKWRAYASKQKSGREFSAYVKERRSRKTGGQLTAGNVLKELKIDPYFHPNAYEVLREASVGVGVDYTDSAGRYHKLYTWGDLSIVAQRLKEGSWVLRERRERRAKAPELTDELQPEEQGPEDLDDIPF